MTEAEQWEPDLYELSASAVMWRGEEILVMKRAMGFSSGGWFIPGGHVDPGEAPIDACVREIREETGIGVVAADLSIVDVMSYDAGGKTAHTIIYNVACPDGAEADINEEHVATRWMTPEAYIDRFLDGGRLRELGIKQSAIDLAEEVARVTRSAAAAWRG
jgi:8-oxo-dGTP diphosphatase